jgi:hypothetical protein
LLAGIVARELEWLRETEEELRTEVEEPELAGIKDEALLLKGNVG